MKTLFIAVGLVAQREKILMLQRADDRAYSPGLWEPIGAFVGRHEPIEAAMVRNVAALTGIDARVSGSGPAFECADAGAWWVVKPYLLEPISDPSDVALTARHGAHQWITPEEALELDCVDGMREDFEALGLLAPTVAA